MCGLWGVATVGFLSAYDLRIFKQLGLLASFRGEDSSGIAIARKKKDTKIAYHIEKDIVPTGELLSRPKVHKEMGFGVDGAIAIIGHARLATSGAVNHQNAHPIQVGQIIATHNGSIAKFDQGKDNPNTNDSRIFISKIAESGIDQAADEVDDGAYALAYFDTSSRTLNFARNMKRPLFCLWSSTGNTVWWASEAGMLNLVRDREGHGAFRTIQHFEAEKLYTLQLGSEKVCTRELKLPVAEYHREENRDKWKQHLRGRGYKVIDDKPALKVNELIFCKDCKRDMAYCFCDADKTLGQYPMLPAPKTSAPNVPRLSNTGQLMTDKEARYYEENKGQAARVTHLCPLDSRTYRYYKDRKVTVDQIAWALKKGCQMCGEEKGIEDPIYWNSAESYLCMQCLKDPFIWQYVGLGNGIFAGKLLTGKQTKTDEQTRH